MTPQERLELYEKALVDYRSSLGKDFEYKRQKATMAGFCAYFKYTHNLDVYLTMEQDLPELYAYKPHDANYSWFICGAIKPRIELLKKAIELVKQKI